ncbi:MAG: hypothetical protein ACR2RF_07555 [Geminicoccaceae bacterium]
MSVRLRDRRGRMLALAVLLTASALTGAGFVQAEVVDTHKPAAKENGLAIHEEPVALECWQKGRRIIQREGLRGLAVKAITQNGAVAFKQINGEQPDIFLLPFEDSLCLVSPEG